MGHFHPWLTFGTTIFIQLLLEEVDYDVHEEERLDEYLLPQKYLNEVVHILNHEVGVHNCGNQAVEKNNYVPNFEIHGVLTDCELDLPQMLQLDLRVYFQLLCLHRYCFL